MFSGATLKENQERSVIGFPNHQRVVIGLWPDERVEVLKRMWEAGDSASIIAARIGVSRNAVLGKAWRMNLDGRKRIAPPPREKKPIKTKEQAADDRRARMATARAERERLVAIEIPDPRLVPSETAVSFFELEQNHCRWPYGDPRDFKAMLFCGAEKADEGSYCWHHRKASRV